MSLLKRKTLNSMKIGRADMAKKHDKCEKNQFFVLDKMIKTLLFFKNINLKLNKQLYK